MKKLLYIVLILLTSVFANDHTASNTFESDTNKTIINDIPLSYKISILGSNSRFVYDLLDARVTIKNKDSNRHYLEYKFVWYDIGGFEVAKKLSKWKQIRIDAKDTIVLKDLAVSSKIDSFKFYIRGLEN